MPTVTSRDGTTIGYEKHGDGPAVILVDGALGYRTMGFSGRLAELLTQALTVTVYDRRGRGESGDTLPFTVQREIEDIDALIDEAGGSAFVYGISSGGCLALEAAIALQDKVEKLALYEPPYDSNPATRPQWRQYWDQVHELAAAGRSDDAVALFMAFVGVPPEMIDGMRSSPAWPSMTAVAHTLPYDAEAIGPDRSVPIERASNVMAPTLVMSGTASLPFMPVTAQALAKAIPNARYLALEGQTHDVDPEVLAPVLVDFFTGG